VRENARKTGNSPRSNAEICNINYILILLRFEMFFWCGFCEAQFNRMITWVAFNQQWLIRHSVMRIL
jgi:hypothetical protein